MKLAISVVSTAILTASVSAGIASYAKGACPSASSVAYDVGMATLHDHNLLYLDTTSMKGLNFITKVLSKTSLASSIPDLSCKNLGEFPYTTDVYNDLFADTTDMIQFKLLYFDTLTGSQLVYSCLDEDELKSLINYGATEAGITIPTWISNLLAKAFLGGHYNLFFVLSDSTSISSSIQTDMITAAQAYDSDFSMDNLAAFDWTSC